MARNYVHEGKTLTLPVPVAGVTSGLGVLIGGIFAVALQTVAYAVGAVFDGQVTGVWDLAKTSAQTWAEGQPIFWNTATSKCDSDSSTGPLVGCALAVAASPSSVGRVRLGASTGSAGRPSTTIAAAGSVQGDAALLPVTTFVSPFVLVTGADAAKGVVLPAAQAGLSVVVKNGAAAILKVWPAAGDAINAIAANGAMAMASLTSALFWCYDGTTWYTTPTIPS